ncbi:outer membrane protein transport protein [candidate division KSB1 bacterium]|nr:outer membrane protein transport protein [candidate division KSB1 bacterium]RQW02111.1 MAG: hypothetical protein EH222_14125 [candidate division KSB1 bacterium]
MKRAISLLTVLCLTLSATTTLFAAGVDLTGVGARATAMSGSYRAIADDWSAMYWNPAGLAYTTGLGAGLSVDFVMPRATFQVANSHYYMNYGGSAFKPFSAAYPVEVAAEPQNFVVPSGGVTFNLGRLAFGVGAWAPFGLGAKWDLLQTAKNNLGRIPGVLYDEYNAAYPNVEYESDMQLIDIHPTIAFKVSDKLSIGAGFSYIIADIAIRQPAFLQNPYLYNQQLYQYLASVSDGGALTTLNLMRQPPFDHLINDVQMTASGNGYGANFGIMFKPTKSLSIGASLQYYTELDLEGTYKETTYFGSAPIFDGVSRAYADSLLNYNIINAEQYLIISNFYSGQVVTRTDLDDAKAKVPLPIKFGIGLSYSGFEKLLLALDFTYTQWSAWDIIPIMNSAGAEVSELVENWKDTFLIGLGFEYNVGIAKLRGGISTETRAAVDETMSLTIPDTNLRTKLNVGLAIPLGPVALALNYEKIFIGDNTIDVWNYTDAIASNMAGTYMMSVNNLMIGLDYSF